MNPVHNSLLCACSLVVEEVVVVLGFYTLENYIHEVCSMGSSLDKVAAGNVHIHEFGYLAPDRKHTSSDTLVVVEEVVMSLCT